MLEAMKPEHHDLFTATLSRVCQSFMDVQRVLHSEGYI